MTELETAAPASLANALREHGLQHDGTKLGKLLQWAALHIDEQDAALSEAREEYADEENERIRLEQALHDVTVSVEAALAAAKFPVCPPIELGRDLAPHINLMGAMGDPDYQTPNGKMSMRHVDTRSSKPRKGAKT